MGLFAANPSFISSSYWTDGIGTTAALACIRKMREQNVQASVWKLGEDLKTGLEKLSVTHPAIKLKVGGMPCSPSLTFDLGPSSAPAKTLMIRKMLSRGYLMSSQLDVMQAHTTNKVDAMLGHLGEVLSELVKLAATNTLMSKAFREISVII